MFMSIKVTPGQGNLSYVRTDKNGMRRNNLKNIKKFKDDGSHWLPGKLKIIE